MTDTFDNLHTVQQALESWKLVCQMASLTKDGETDDDGHEFDMPNDDAYDTLHSLIESARVIYGGGGLGGIDSD